MAGIEILADFMQAILAVTVPFFALVLCGYLAARRHVLPESAIPGLNAFVLYFALPCMLFRFGMNTPVFDLLNPVVLVVYLCAALLIVFFTIAVSSSLTASSKVNPYWKPEHPPPVTKTRSFSSGLPSSSMRDLTFSAALSEKTSGAGLSVISFMRTP